MGIGARTVNYPFQDNRLTRGCNHLPLDSDTGMAVSQKGEAEGFLGERASFLIQVFPDLVQHDLNRNFPCHVALNDLDQIIGQFSPET